MDTITVITIAIAIYGALLSTYTAIDRLKENKVKIESELRLGFILPSNKQLVFLSAGNHGRKPVSMSIGLFTTPDGSSFIAEGIGENPKMPCEISPGQKCEVWLEANLVADFLAGQGSNGRVKLGGMFNDQLGRSYKAKPLEFDIEKWRTSRPS